MPAMAVSAGYVFGPKQTIMKISQFDAEELAAELCGITDEQREDSTDLELALYDKYGCDLSQFEDLVKDLAKRLDIGVSPLTHDVIHGFSNTDQNQWIAKEKITEKFINAVVQWMTEGEELKPGDKGFKREITNNGKIEFVLSIVPAPVEAVQA